MPFGKGIASVDKRFAKQTRRIAPLGKPIVLFSKRMALLHKLFADPPELIAKQAKPMTPFSFLYGTTTRGRCGFKVYPDLNGT